MAPPLLDWPELAPIMEEEKPMEVEDEMVPPEEPPAPDDALPVEEASPLEDDAPEDDEDDDDDDVPLVSPQVPLLQVPLTQSSLDSQPSATGSTESS